MVMFAFALDNDNVLTRVAPGLVWLATMFSMLVLVQRSFAVESADGALDALQVAGVRPAGIFLGKSMALAAQLAPTGRLVGVERGPDGSWLVRYGRATMREWEREAIAPLALAPLMSGTAAAL